MVIFKSIQICVLKAFRLNSFKNGLVNSRKSKIPIFVNLFVSLIPKDTSGCISKAIESVHKNPYVETQESLIAIFHDSVADTIKSLECVLNTIE